MKQYLKSAPCMIALGCTSLAHSVKIELKLAHLWPKGFPIFGTSVDDYEAMFEELSDRRIDIKVDSRNNKQKLNTRVNLRSTAASIRFSNNSGLGKTD